MKLTIDNKGTEVLVRLAGELDTVATVEQADELKKIIELAGKQLVIDCEDLEYISSAGLRFFMQLKRESESRQGNVQLQNLNEDVSEIFRMSGFNNIFTIK